MRNTVNRSCTAFTVSLNNKCKNTQFKIKTYILNLTKVKEQQQQSSFKVLHH